MKCMFNECGGTLIWGGDHSGEDYGCDPTEVFMVSNHSCDKCGLYVEAYWPTKKDEKTEKEDQK